MSTRTVNVYDFDHTIYDGDASMDFITYCLRRYPRSWKYLPSQAFVIGLYVLRLRSRKQVKQVAFAFLREIKNIDSVVNNFWKTHEHNIKPWYLNQRHSTDLIISASPYFLLAPIAKKLGISSPIATEMNPKTGKIIGENCRANEKVIRLRKYDPAIKIDSCYSDSLSDMPLLSLAKHAYIVKKHSVTTLPGHE